MAYLRFECRQPNVADFDRMRDFYVKYALGRNDGSGIFWAAFHGNMGEVTNGLLDSAKEAVTLGVTMLGIMSFWCGILKIGERAGLIER